MKEMDPNMEEISSVSRSGALNLIQPDGWYMKLVLAASLWLGRIDCVSPINKRKATDAEDGGTMGDGRSCTAEEEENMEAC